jgi:hypothetical protein
VIAEFLVGVDLRKVATHRCRGGSHTPATTAVIVATESLCWRLSVACHRALRRGSDHVR